MRKGFSLLLMALVFLFTPTTFYAEDSDQSHEHDESKNPLYQDSDEDESDVEILDTTPEDPVSNEPITEEQLVEGKPVDGLTENSQFVPSGDPEDPTVDFNGTLELDNTDMGTSPENGKGIKPECP